MKPIKYTAEVDYDATPPNRLIRCDTEPERDGASAGPHRVMLGPSAQTMVRVTIEMVVTAEDAARIRGFLDMLGGCGETRSP